tara:strand:- start:231 stop:554 length:324 start_codon:yes stop_codon:yes gene_type:complete
MKLNKFFQISLGALFAFPVVFFGVEILANNLSDNVEYEMYNDQLLSCGGGGGGGGGGGKPGALKTKKLTTKLNFKKRQLSKAAAAGKDTSSLQAEISKIEAALAEMD